MRAYLEDWILHDGQLPEPAVGDTLRGIGLEMICTSAGPSAGADSWRVAEPKPPGEWTTIIEMDAEVVARRDDPEAGVVRVGHQVFVVQGEWKDLYDVPEDRDPIDMRVVPVGLPAVGSRVSLVGSMGVMAEHELEPGYTRFDMGSEVLEVRANWVITAIHKERRASGRTDVEVTSIERIDVWSDMDEPGIYVLDLVPSEEPYEPPTQVARLLSSARDSLIPLRLRLHMANLWFRRHWPWGRRYAG